MKKLRVKVVMVFVLILTGCITSPFYCWGLEAKGGVYHLVSPGQTLWRIAHTYQLPLEEIMRANGIRATDQIRAGRRIFIPGAAQILEVEVVRPSKASEPVSQPAERVPPTVIVETSEESPIILETSGEGEEIITTAFIWPVDGRIISPFGTRNGHRHKGIDIKAEEGTPIRAVAEGIVIYSANKMQGYGNAIIIRHDPDFSTVYSHNEVNLVEEGDWVREGQIIGRIGQTGRATTAHLHFEIWEGSAAKNPLPYLP